MLDAFLKYEFLQNAVMAGILAGIICGIIGVIITEKKMLMISGGIAHTAYGGVGLGYLLGFEPIIGAGIFSVISALVIGKINRKARVHTDIIIALLWSLGMALGVAFTSLMPGYPPDMNSYLFGNILSVLNSDIYIILTLCIITVAVTTIFWKDWKAFLFDRQFSEVMGINTSLLEYILLIMISLCVVALIRLVGIILVIALLSAPAACSARLSRNLKNRIFMSIAFSIFFCLAGLVFSFYLNIPSGATIVFFATISYFLIYFITNLKFKKIK